MNDTDKILRYLYLGTVEPFHIYKNKPLDMELGRQVLGPVEIAGGASYEAAATSLTESPVDTITKAMKSGSLIRKDECLFALAFTIRTTKKGDERSKVYALVPKLIEQSRDLFQFVYYFHQLANSFGGIGFGHGIKVAIRKWYAKHSPEELAKILATDIGYLGWTHKHVLRRARVFVKEEATKPMLLMIKHCGKSKRTQQEEEEAKVNKDGEQKPQVDSEALKLFNRIKKFKSVDNAAVACAGIQEYKYSLHLVNPNLLRSSDVWVKLFPCMPYRDLVKAALLLQDFKLLTENDSPLSVAYGHALNRMKSVTESKLHPIFIYQVMRMFEERQRYQNVVKEAVHTSNNLSLKNCKANPMVMKQFSAVLNQSMMNYERTGLRFLVTLDLRSKQSKKRVFCNRLMSCQAAYILLTLPMVKREPHMKVMTFTENPDQLAEVELTREMDFYKACEKIQAKALKKTKVRLTKPIEYALEKKMPVDVFITVVDSLVRVNPTRNPPLYKLDEYNQQMKQQARFIVVNLSRHKQDFHFEPNEPTNGVLELLGCNEDTPKLIDAYGKHHFV